MLAFLSFVSILLASICTMIRSRCSPFVLIPTYLNIIIVLFNCKIHYLQRLALCIILIHLIINFYLHLYKKKQWDTLRPNHVLQV